MRYLVLATEAGIVRPYTINRPTPEAAREYLAQVLDKASKFELYEWPKGLTSKEVLGLMRAD